MLVEGLESSDDDVILTSVLALGDYGDRSAIPQLVKLLEQCPLQEELPKGKFRSMMSDILDAIIVLTTLDEYRDILAKNQRIIESYVNALKKWINDITRETKKAYLKKRKAERNSELDKMARDLRRAAKFHGEYLGLFERRWRNETSYEKGWSL